MDLKFVELVSKIINDEASYMYIDGDVVMQYIVCSGTV